MSQLINAMLPSTLFFEDGSRVDYLSRNDTIRYISPTGCKIDVPLSFNQETDELHVQISIIKQWEEPKGKSFTDEEIDDVKAKVSLFVEKKGKPFVI